MSLCESHSVSWGSWKSISVRNKFKWFPQTGLTQCRGWGVSGPKENCVVLCEQKEVETTLFVRQSKNKNSFKLMFMYSLIFFFTCRTLTPPSHPSRYPQARYKQSLDPTVDEVKKLCTSLRRNAKEERVLFHYNGHGVPRPTVNGEIWVFNKVRSPCAERPRSGSAPPKRADVTRFSPPSCEPCLWSGKSVCGTVKVMGECAACGGHSSSHNSALWPIWLVHQVEYAQLLN